MRREAATLIPVDRPAKLGDTVTMDYEGKIDGVAFEGGTATGQETELSEDRFIPGFVDGIVGMTAGQTKDVPAKFPDPYSNEDLAGKDAVFTITVHEIKEPELPALDDELAKRVSRSENLADLRAEVKRRLDETVKRNARRHFQGELLDKLTAANDFPLPDVLVERELANVLNETRQYVVRAGIPWDDYLEKSGKSEESLRQDARPEAAAPREDDAAGRGDREEGRHRGDPRGRRERARGAVRPVRAAAREDHRGAAGQRAGAHRRHRPHEDHRPADRAGPPGPRPGERAGRCN